MPGHYFISAGIFDNSRTFVDWVEYAASFHVEPSFSSGRAYDHRLGKVTLLGEWANSHENNA
jgi:lipopolysaccharide transport system ATP-binding protein